MNVAGSAFYAAGCSFGRRRKAPPTAMRMAPRSTRGLVLCDVLVDGRFCMPATAWPWPCVWVAAPCEPAEISGLVWNPATTELPVMPAVVTLSVFAEPPVVVVVVVVVPLGVVVVGLLALIPALRFPFAVTAAPTAAPKFAW